MPIKPFGSSFLIKVIIPIITVIIACGSVIFAMESRYVSQEEAGKSLQNFDTAIKKDLIHLEIQILNTQKDNLMNDYHKQYQLVKQNPSDEFYKKELERIEIRLEKINEKIDSRISIGTDSTPNF